MYDAQEKARRDYQWAMQSSMREGEMKGKMEGKMEGEIKLIHTFAVNSIHPSNSTGRIVSTDS